MFYVVLIFVLWLFAVVFLLGTAIAYLQWKTKAFVKNYYTFKNLRKYGIIFTLTFAMIALAYFGIFNYYADRIDTYKTVKSLIENRHTPELSDEVLYNVGEVRQEYNDWLIDARMRHDKYKIFSLYPKEIEELEPILW